MTALPHLLNDVTPFRSIKLAITDMYGVEHEIKTDSSCGVQLLGDADGDGSVTILDATTIQRYDVKMISLSETALRLADVDGNNEVSIIDATWIQRWELQMKAPEGIGEPIDI